MSSEQTSQANESPWAALQGELLQAWAKAAQTMASSAPASLGQIADKLFSSQMGTAALLEQLALAWQALSPIIERGGDWESALKAHVAKVRDELMQSATSMGKTGAALGQLFSSYVEQWQSLGGPLVRQWKAMTESMAARMMGQEQGQGSPASGSRAWLWDMEMASQAWKAYQESMGMLLGGPGLGYSRELDEEVKRSVALWLKMQQAASEYETILAEIGAASLEQMMKILIAKAQRGEDISSLRALIDQWSAIADKAFKEAYSQTRYVKAQGELVNASMRFRIAARELTERYLKNLDIPTRAEVDEAHRRIYELGLGNIPGEFMNLGFLMLKPFELGLKKYVSFLDMVEREESVASFLRMETWIFDSPDQAGEAWREFIRDFYLGNKLIKGKIVLGGRSVLLSNLTMPLLNLYAEQDHLVPPSSPTVLGHYVGTKDYTVESFPVGHVGMYVSGSVQHRLPPTIANWLKQRG